MDARQRAESNWRRALTRHTREQIAGRTDGSVAQTRRMYLAVEAARRAWWRYQEACRAHDRQRAHQIRQSAAGIV